MTWLSYIFPRHIAGSRSTVNGRIEVKEIRGQKTLLVEGIQQTGPYPNVLWKRGFADACRLPAAPKQILVLGVGGGEVLGRLASLFPDAAITGVDIDAEIIRLARAHFSIGTIPGLTLVCEDAQVFVQKERKKFNLVIVDLYVANDVPSFATGDTFMAGVSRLLCSGGRLIMNYFHATDQARQARSFANKLSKYFISVSYRPVLRNIFFYVVK